MVVITFTLGSFGSAVAHHRPSSGVPFQLITADWVTAIGAVEGGVAYIAHGGIHIYRNGQVEPDRNQSAGWGVLVETGAGELIVNGGGQDRSLRIWQDGASMPVYSAAPGVAYAAAFGPDGVLNLLVAGQLVRVAADRTSEIVLNSTPADAIAFSPTGELYLTLNRTIQRLEPSGMLTPIVRSQASPVFDMSGRLYTVVGESDGMLTVTRHDLALGTNETISHFYTGTRPWDRMGLAASGDRLYILHRPGTGFFELGVPMFQGYRPAFKVPSAADLAITNLEVALEYGPDGTDALAKRRIDVTIANIGDMDVSQPFTLRVDRFGIGGTLIESTSGEPSSYVRTVQGLPMGASTLVSIPWDSTFSLGNYTVRALVDHPYFSQVMELEEESNNYGYATHVVKADPIRLANDLL